MKKYLVILALIFPLVTSAQTVNSTTELQNAITQVQAQIQLLQTQTANSQANTQPTKIGFTLNRILMRGTTGDDVKQLQTFLKTFPVIYPEGLISGYFGPLTENAIKRFQLIQGVRASGIVDALTGAKLNKYLINGITNTSFSSTGGVSIPGATGPTGLTGPIGNTGATGPAGATGAPGITGAIGTTGTVGAIGATGSAGAAGAVGATGTPGVQGPAGPTSPFSNYRAGTITLSTGSSNTTVSWTTALSANTYRVALTFSGNPNFGNNNAGWGYMQVTTKGTSSFIITLRSNDGSAKNAPAGTIVDWVVLMDSN